jgi:hypothetical protein
MKITIDTARNTGTSISTRRSRKFSNRAAAPLLHAHGDYLTSMSMMDCVASLMPRMVSGSFSRVVL